MKTIYLVHGWSGSGSGGWFDWVKEHYEKKGWKVVAFDMPDTDSPTIEKWVGFLRDNVKELNEDVYFIGYSIGVQTILRYFEQLEDGIKIGGCFFVAGWFHLIDSGNETAEDMALAKPWIETPIDFDNVKNHCDRFYSLFSSNDYYVPLSDVQIFKVGLNSQTKILENKGHFEAETEIPEILDFIN